MDETAEIMGDYQEDAHVVADGIENWKRLQKGFKNVYNFLFCISYAIIKLNEIYCDIN